MHLRTQHSPSLKASLSLSLSLLPLVQVCCSLPWVHLQCPLAAASNKVHLGRVSGRRLVDFRGGNDRSAHSV